MKLNKMGVTVRVVTFRRTVNGDIQEKALYFLESPTESYDSQPIVSRTTIYQANGKRVRYGLQNHGRWTKGYLEDKIEFERIELRRDGYELVKVEKRWPKPNTKK